MVKNKEKISYLSLVFILFILFFSFLIIFIHPHNLKDIKTIDENPNYNESTLFLDDISKVESYVHHTQESVSEDANSLKENNKITELQYQEINSYLSKSISNYNYYYESRNNKSLYLSFWYAEKADSLVNQYPIQNEIDSSLNTLDKFNNYFFYISDEKIKIVGELKNDYNRFNNFQEYNTEPPESIDNIIRDINSFENFNDDYHKVSRMSRDFNKYIVADYTYQSWLFKIKLFDTIVVLTIVFCLGWMFSKIKFTTIKKSILEIKSDTFNWFKEIFFPKEVKSETITEILKLNSFLFAFVTLVSTIAIVLNLNKGIILILFVPCVLFSLTSIFLGVIAINKDSNDFRKACYWLFQLGLFFAISILFELILGIGLNSLVDTGRDALNSFLNSTTTISK